MKTALKILAEKNDTQYGATENRKQVNRVNLILCLDNRNGMSFNGRKQSRDRMVDADVEMLSKEEGIDRYIRIDFWKDAPKEEEIEEILVYRWDKKYPADEFCPIDFSKWTLVEQKEFAGYSHEKITRERYKRKDG